MDKNAKFIKLDLTVCSKTFIFEETEDYRALNGVFKPSSWKISKN